MRSIESDDRRNTRMVALGWFQATGDKATRKATSLIEVGSNSGPVYAAIAIGSKNDAEILGGTTACLSRVGQAQGSRLFWRVSLPTASRMGLR